MAGKRCALLIDNNAYCDAEFPPLTKPARDVADFAALLRDPQIGAFDKVTECVDRSWHEARLDISRFFKQRDKDDLLLLYFSGHGRRESGEFYLVFSDTAFDDLDATAINAQFVRKHIDGSPSLRKIIILDCCYSGAFGEKGAAAGAADALNAFEGNGYGRIILTASKATETAQELPKGLTTPNSLFTHFLLEGIRTGQADRDNDGDIAADELFEYVSDQMRAIAAPQTPQRFVAAQHGEIVIAQNPSWKPPEPPRPTLPDWIETLLISEQVAARLSAITNLDALRASGDPGLLAAIRQRLEHICASDKSSAVRGAARGVLEEIGSALAPEQPPIPPQQPVMPKPTATPQKRSVPWLAVLSLLIIFGSVYGLALWQPWKPFLKPDPSPTATPNSVVVVPPTATPEPTTAPTKQPEPTATPQPTVAKLTVRSNVSDDIVFVDGKTLGKTPLTIELPIGSHTIRIEKAGYRPFEQTLDLQTASTIKAILEPEPTPTPTATPEPTATPTKQPEPTATPTPAEPQAGSTWTEPTTGMKFVYVPGGCFQMGSPEGEDGRDSDETQHQVCIHKDEGFWIGKYEVTNAQYRRFKANHDSQSYKDKSLNGDDQPAVFVSWEEAKAFAEWLTKQGQGTFRLPTEAEWEYAARAGTTTARYWNDNPDDACQYANVADQTAKKLWTDWTVHNCDDGYAVTSPVGKFKPNAFGLYDMLGNVYEWCQDTYGNYSETPKDGSAYTGGSNRVLRGGSWRSVPRDVRSANRSLYDPANRSGNVGFRVLRTK